MVLETPVADWLGHPNLAVPAEVVDRSQALVVVGAAAGTAQAG